MWVSVLTGVAAAVGGAVIASIYQPSAWTILFVGLVAGAGVYLLAIVAYCRFDHIQTGTYQVRWYGSRCQVAGSMRLSVRRLWPNL